MTAFLSLVYRKDLSPTLYLITSFIRHIVYPLEGMIKLPRKAVTQKENIYQVVADYIIIDVPSMCNYIFGRPLLNSLKAT